MIGNRIYKKDVLFITANTDFVKSGLEKGGYSVMHPYCYRTIVGRLLLEVAHRLKLPHAFLFNKDIKKNKHSYIIVQDMIITKSFLEWLLKECPLSKIVFQYTNMVGKAHHLLPNEIPDEISVWTYDKYDSDKYGINLSKCGGYYTAYIGTRKEIKYDIMYVGKDKGRAEEIISLQKQFESMGLKTKFLIMPTTRTSMKKDFYSKSIPYEEVINLVTESKAILNIALPNQQGATLRDYESIFNEVKLITTNRNIKSFDFYDKNNIFVLGEDDMNNLCNFINTPYKKIDSIIVNKYSLDEMVKEILDGERGV